MNLNWSKKQTDYLFHHILRGFEGSTQGIEIAHEQHLITDEEYTDLLRKNSKRLIDRIKEFKIVYKLLSVAFAFLFSYLQVSGEDLDARRPVRVRARSARHARVRVRRGRRNEELFDDGCSMPFILSSDIGQQTSDV